MTHNAICICIHSWVKIGMQGRYYKCVHKKILLSIYTVLRTRPLVFHKCRLQLDKILCSRVIVNHGRHVKDFIVLKCKRKTLTLFLQGRFCHRVSTSRYEPTALQIFGIHGRFLCGCLVYISCLCLAKKINWLLIVFVCMFHLNPAKQKHSVKVLFHLIFVETSQFSSSKEWCIDYSQIAAR